MKFKIKRFHVKIQNLKKKILLKVLEQLDNFLQYSKNKLKKNIFVEARAIFILLAAKSARKSFNFSSVGRVWPLFCYYCKRKKKQFCLFKYFRERFLNPLNAYKAAVVYDIKAVLINAKSCYPVCSRFPEKSRTSHSAMK